MVSLRVISYKMTGFQVYCFPILCAYLLVSTTMASDVARVAASNSEFARDMFNSLSKKEGNVFFSPISAHIVLSMALQGAAGETAQKMALSLKVPDSKVAATGYQDIVNGLNSVQNVTLNVANKVYIKTGYQMKQTFQEVVTKSFYSEAQPVEFSQKEAAAKTINSWVESKTNNKIKDLISPDNLDNLTRMILVSAIYFKGDWADKFEKEATKTQPFWISATEKVDCQMMHKTREYRYANIEALAAQVIEIPYKNPDVSLVVVLPNARDGIKALEAKLATWDLTQLTKDLYETEVVLSLPKFKIETTMDLEDTLRELGMDVIFSNNANFQNLIDSPEPLKVSKVVQKAFIEVNEEGSEAAAATAVLFQTRSEKVYIQVAEFHVDHPFIAYIKSKIEGVDQVLFSGRINTVLTN